MVSVFLLFPWMDMFVIARGLNTDVMKVIEISGYLGCHLAMTTLPAQVTL